MISTTTGLRDPRVEGVPPHSFHRTEVTATDTNVFAIHQTLSPDSSVFI